MDFPSKLNTQYQQEDINGIFKKDTNALALLNSLKNTQTAMTLLNNLSNSLSLITEKYIDSLAQAHESINAIEEMSDIISENYSDDIELKVLVDKILAKKSSSQHIKYIKSLHELSALASIVSSGIKDYDGDISTYYEFNEKINSLGLF
ncbi:hypothetical protein CMI47_18345 [Candidatus Pacearchaeota archaeon]|jgi:hypothetical protein|nr:hypothetical protein [Candidatus Pacearchaeota archaeon]|tara:strand:- start:3807 stop:4253 length:447 start_codon:yes stop_codon:yes gene_type:complete